MAAFTVIRSSSSLPRELSATTATIICGMRL
jgi:hypothetical protein